MEEDVVVWETCVKLNVRVLEGIACLRFGHNNSPHSTLNTQHSTLDTRRSTLDTRHWATTVIDDIIEPL